MKKIIFSVFVCLVISSCHSDDDSDLLNQAMASAPVLGEWGIDRYIFSRVDGTEEILDFQEDECARNMSLEFIRNGTSKIFIDQIGVANGCEQINRSGGYLRWTLVVVDNYNIYEFTFRSDSNGDEFVYLAFVDFPTEDTMVISYDGIPPYLPGDVYESFEEHYFRK